MNLGSALRPATLIGLMALAPASAARAQNILPSGEFDTDVLPWITAGQASLGWAAVDHSGCSSTISGTAQATNFSTGAAQERGFAACTGGIVAGDTYSFGADLRFPTSQASTGEAHIVALWFTNATCSGLSSNTADGDITVTTASAGSWVRVRNDGALAPANTHSVSFSVRLLKNEAAGTLNLDFDGAYLSPTPGFQFGDGFDRQSTCHWTAAVP